MTIKQVIEKFVPELNESEVEKTRRKWSEKYRDYLLLTELNDGVKEILEFLKDKVKIGAVTNRSQTTVLSHHKIIDFFDSIITSSDVIKPKPSPEGILKALNQLKVKPEQAIFIGDAETDVIAGNSAGVKMLVYQVKLNGDAEKIDSFEELKNYLK